MTHDFKTKPVSSDIQGLNHFLKFPNDDEFDTDRSVIEVFYSLDFDLREYGVADVSVSVIKVEAQIEWSIAGDELSAEEKKSLIAAGGTELRNGNFEGMEELIIRDGEDGWVITQDASFDTDGSFDFSSILIDLKDKEITLS